MTRSVDGRELGMSPTLPFRPGELGGQFREPEVEVRRARMDPVMDRLSAAFATKEVEGESCVSWTREAIDVLKRMGALQPDFDIERVMDTALGFADESLKGKGKIGSILDYTGRGGV